MGQLETKVEQRTKPCKKHMKPCRKAKRVYQLLFREKPVAHLGGRFKKRSLFSPSTKPPSGIMAIRGGNAHDELEGSALYGRFAGHCSNDSRKPTRGVLATALLQGIARRMAAFSQLK